MKQRSIVHLSTSFGPDEAECSRRRVMRKVRLAFTAAIVALIAAGWAGDVVSLEGERTIYTVECERGSWFGDACAGRLVAGERIRFHAFKEQAEVLFWRVGESRRADRLAPCAVQDGRNWSCTDDVDAPRTITLALAQGRVQPDSRTRPCHVVPKWKWLLLRAHLAS